MVTTGLCERCGLRMTSRETVERRLEYRSIVGLERLRTWRLSLICRGCALEEWEAHDHPHGRQGEQGSLL